MAEAIKDIVVRITAKKEGFESLDSAALTLGSFSQKVEVANTASLSFSDRISKSAKGFESFGSMGLEAIHILNRIEISQMNVENAAASGANAQLRYNEALAKYGENSREVFIAGNELARSQNNVEKANQRASISMVAIGVSAVGQIPAIMGFATTMVTQLKKVELATLLTTTRIRAMAPELLILSAIAGGAYYLISSQAAAAQEAQEELGRAMAGSFSTANDEAEKLKRNLEDITNTMRTTEEKKIVREIEYKAKIEAIKTDPRLSTEEKLAEIAKEQARFDEDRYNLKLDNSRKALSIANEELANADKNKLTEKDRQKFLDVRKTAMSEIYDTELAKQKRIREEEKREASGYKGVGMFSKGEKPLIVTKTLSEMEIKPSKALEDALKLTEEKKKEIDVNVKRWEAGAIPIGKIEKEPGLFQKALGVAPTAYGLAEAYQISQHKTPFIIQLGEMLASVKALIPTTAGIPLLPATEGYRQAITIILDKEGTREFFKDGFIDTLRYG